MSKRKNCRRGNSGQLLIVAALAIAILISSTTTYVYELSRETDNADAPSTSNFVLVLKQATKNAVIGSLANASSGGTNTVLAANLGKLVQTVRSVTQYGICSLSYATFNGSGYDSGVRIAWGADGEGVSSACTDFTLQIYGVASKVTAEYAANVTSLLGVSSSYTSLGSGEKNVNLTCVLNDENGPALAKDVVVFYGDGGNWMQANASNGLVIVDCGTGTYMVSFTVAVSDPVQVSVRVVDLRDILVCANATCPAV